MPPTPKATVLEIEEIREVAAQKHIREQEKWGHPYFWAAWVLWGLPD